MSKIKIICEPENVSDGCHTLAELYDHRNLLYIALMRSNPEISWKSLKHEDGSCFDGWFLACMELPSGDISYHLPIKYWDDLDIKTFNVGKEWDGHDSHDVLDRLIKFNQ